MTGIIDPSARPNSVAGPNAATAIERRLNSPLSDCGADSADPPSAEIVCFIATKSSADDRVPTGPVAGALRLDEAERAHLFDLARASNDRTAGRRRSPAKRTVRPSIAWMIDAMTGAAVFVVNGRQDILAVNHLGRAFCAPMFESPAPANMARFTYLDPRAKDFFAVWNRAAKECVAALRTQAGRDPFDRGLSDLVGELSTLAAVGVAGHFLQVHEPVAVRVGEVEHRRRAVEVHDLVVVHLRARLAQARVGGLGVGRAQSHGHRDLAIRRQQHQSDARPGRHHFYQPGPWPYLDVGAQLAAEHLCVKR
jgi:hypothetical protein